MNRGPEYPERRPGRERRAPAGGTGDADFADFYSGLDFGGGRANRGRPAGGQPPAQPGADPRQAPAGRDDEDYTPASSIRSYAWTGGRTRSDVELELETLVSTSEHYRPGMPVRQEHQSVAQLCQNPRSVAEIGALLGVPYGVAKVLLADMAAQNLVDVHQTVTDTGSAPHLMLMERVLSGLRRL